MNISFFTNIRNRHAFTLMEVLVSMSVVGIIGLSIFVFQTSTWMRSTKANRTIMACHVIERQIEAIRMTIDKSPETNFPPHDSSFTESGTGVSLSWKILPASRPTPDSGNLVNVRKCDFTASWGTSKEDTLKVTTYLSKMF